MKKRKLITLNGRGIFPRIYQGLCSLPLGSLPEGIDSFSLGGLSMKMKNNYSSVVYNVRGGTVNPSPHQEKNVLAKSNTPPDIIDKLNSRWLKTTRNFWFDGSSLSYQSKGQEVFTTIQSEYNIIKLYHRRAKTIERKKKSRNQMVNRFV